VIKDDALQSKAWWAPRIVPPKQAPNILLIMTDDSGFGVPSTFGGVIPTPTMDRVAKAGLRYNNIHSTALCSPTRAALITGRNHHSAGFGVISEQATGFPGYNSIIAKDKATIGRILLDNGYATSWFGKDHNTPAFEASAIGPFDRWPTGMGFEYFYGFIGGDSNQWKPNLFRNTTQIYPFEGKPGWNLVTGMADDAIDYLNRTNKIDPRKPLFCYYAPGATPAEGGPLGTPNEVAFFNGINMMPVAEQMKWYDVWGTDQTYAHMSAGWSWAFDTPFTWFKQNASRLGGIRQCMAVSWPGHIKDQGALREQFMHVIDVVPTLLEVTGISAPETVDGIKQAPIEGMSFAYTFDAKNAKEPSRHKTQYFEMF